MSSYESFDWNEWWDSEALETERLDADMYLQELEEAARQDAADKAAALLMVELAPDLDDYYEGDLGGVIDGFGHVISDADPGL